MPTGRSSPHWTGQTGPAGYYQGACRATWARSGREAHAVILPIVDIGLAHSGAETLADLEDAIAHLRTALADG